MDLTEQLREWGACHARARLAERTASQSMAGSSADPRLLDEARRLRQQADRLHGEIYRRIGRAPAEGRPSA